MHDQQGLYELLCEPKVQVHTNSYTDINLYKLIWFQNWLSKKKFSNQLNLTVFYYIGGEGT